MVYGWPALRDSLFAGRVVRDRSPLVSIHATESAENPALVPVTFTVESPGVRKVWLLVDGNPVPLTAVFHFMQNFPKAHAEVRIRLDKSTMVRVVAEVADGSLHMASVSIKTPGGGCGGGADGDELKLRNEAGRMKFQPDLPVVTGAEGFFTFLLKHPMRTGFERTTQGYYAKAWFINRLDFSQSGQPLLGVDLGVGISADPWLRLPNVPVSAAPVHVLASDNEGKTFSQEFALPEPQ